MAAGRLGPRLWPLALLGLRAVRCQLKILSPEGLAAEFKETEGIVQGTTATFGAPYYDERMFGQLLYSPSPSHHCEQDYTVPKRPSPPPGAEQAVEEPKSILLVHRGKCSFVTKVRVAEEKRAWAVVVIDKEGSTHSCEDLPKFVMADDGSGGSIRIPSIMVCSSDGKKLLDAVEKGTVTVELAWDFPHRQVVIADFWMSSGSRESSLFLQRFRYAAETLKYHLQFVPHYHIFELPEGTDERGLCVPGSGSRTCAPDPDGDGPITGAAVALEDLRQLCLWNVSAAREQGAEKGALYSREFWDYTDSFATDCLQRSTIDEECSFGVMRKLGVATDTIKSCMDLNSKEFYDQQRREVAWSDQALRLNGWRYSGPLDPELIIKALCSSFEQQPHECADLLDSIVYKQATSGAGHWAVVSFSVLAWTILLLLLSLLMLFLFYKRHVTQSVRKVLREEVMLEVQTQMSDYAQLNDADPVGRRTLTF